MINKLIRKIIHKYKGIPIGIIVYKPHTGWEKNIIWQTLLTDDYIDTKVREIAEHVRATYQEDIKKIYEEVEK